MTGFVLRLCAFVGWSIVSGCYGFTVKSGMYWLGMALLFIASISGVV